MIGWRKAGTLKDYSARAIFSTKTPNNLKVPDVMENVARFFSILRRHVSLKTLIGINCNTDFTVYKFHCRSCSKQYVGSNMTDFRYRFNNYKSVFRKVSKSGKPPKVHKEHSISLLNYLNKIVWMTEK